MRKIEAFGMILIGLLVMASFSQAEDKEFFSAEIKVCGDVENPFTLTLAELKKMESVEEKDVHIMGEEEFKGEGDFRGVLLRDIIERAKPIRKKQRVKLYYVVHALDGYYATFSYGELYFTLTGQHTIVSYEKNGKLLGKDEGFAHLIVPTDKYADRFVKWIDRIEIKSGEGVK
jgi:DMSO/TMAO reductase YedYZ molybdopterin-dependent catalytic subunit